MHREQNMNLSEEFVYRVCKQSFLSLWSYTNPQGKDAGKELCDILVVCDPDIVIFSVKEIQVTNSGDTFVDWARWQKRAIDSSCKQIYGAERWIERSSHVIRKDGSQGLAFPTAPSRQVHRVAVALGSQDQVPIHFGDFGKGFTHVFDETSFNIILQELDTISDFVDYLVAKEDLYNAGVATLFEGAEEDLLALYLHHGRRFPEECDFIILDHNLWKGFSNKDEYKAKKLVDRDSYVWDRLIETLCEDALNSNLEFGPSLSDIECAIRVMARETRFTRRILGKSFLEFLWLASQKRVRSRIVPSLSGALYVYLAAPFHEDRNFRAAELGARCFIARGLNLNCKTVVGIATERYEPGNGFSLDLMYLHKPDWTDEDQTNLEFAQKEFGYFVRPLQTPIREDEYPSKSSH